MECDCSECGWPNWGREGSQGVSIRRVNPAIGGLFWFRVQPLKENTYRVPKSRYDSVDLYIANDERNKPEYHDIDVPVNQKVRQRLLEHGWLFKAYQKRRPNWTTFDQASMISLPVISAISLSATPLCNSLRPSTRTMKSQWTTLKISNPPTGKR